MCAPPVSAPCFGHAPASGAVPDPERAEARSGILTGWAPNMVNRRFPVGGGGVSLCRTVMTFAPRPAVGDRKWKVAKVALTVRVRTRARACARARSRRSGVGGGKGTAVQDIDSAWSESLTGKGL